MWSHKYSRSFALFHPQLHWCTTSISRDFTLIASFYTTYKRSEGWLLYVLFTGRTHNISYIIFAFLTLHRLSYYYFYFFIDLNNTLDYKFPQWSPLLLLFLSLVYPPFLMHKRLFQTNHVIINLFTRKLYNELRSLALKFEVFLHS